MFGKNIGNAIVYCGFCNTPVFQLDENAMSYEKIGDSILRSKPIPPQEIPQPNQIDSCATCGSRRGIYNLYIKEGESLG